MTKNKCKNAENCDLLKDYMFITRKARRLEKALKRKQKENEYLFHRLTELQNENWKLLDENDRLYTQLHPSEISEDESDDNDDMELPF